MSNYPEADEAQRRHYNDGHYSPYPPPPPPPGHTPNPYETSHTPNPYEYNTPLPDPFANPPAAAAPYTVHSPPPQGYDVHSPPPQGYSVHSPPPPQGYGGVQLVDTYAPQLDTYAQSPPHHAISPPPVHSPPLHPQQHTSPPLHPQLSPRPGSTPLSYPPNHQRYELRDEQDDFDSGDIPLLRRDPSSSATASNSAIWGQGAMPIPGGYDASGEMTQEESNIRYGRIPQRVPRRYKTIKKVELFHGNFVLDAPIPPKLLSLSPLTTTREFTHMRYTAATCDPNAFASSGFTLRQIHYDPPRRTELFIVMTMYNEDEELFCRTMHGVMRNVAHLCSRERSKTWGKEGWKKVVVCVVSDGRGKVNARTLSVLAAMGCYQEGIAKRAVGSKEVTAHIFEYTTQISVNPNLKIEGAEKGIVPVQVIFCLKEKNQKKINSHRWFFNAFGPILQPNVCVLLDVGTMPGPTSIYHLWKAFDINSNVGGACGEIVALKGKWGFNLVNPLVAAQNFEYKMSNILDKPLESVFGYISVLPGAFSAYRYIALQNDATGEGPLQKYFLGEKMHGAGANIFTANMYLAEDRILCWELVSKRGGSWILHYVKSAYAVTDVPDQVPELISQRRRWLNGSFFAAVHSTFHFYYIYRSSHTFMRKMWIHVEMFYQLFNLIFSWFALANYYIAFSILSSAMEDPQFKLTGIHILNVILNYFYLGLLVMCFILSLGNRPQGSKWGYTMAFIGFALITVYMTIAAFLLAFKGIENLSHADGGLNFGDLFSNHIFRNIVLSLLATLGLYVVASLIFFEPWHMITSFIQYLLLAPSYINVLNVYAFSNVHDVSWGTKGDNKPSADLDVVKTNTGGNEVEVNMPTSDKDIDALYEDAIHVLQTKPPKADTKPDQKTKEEDYYRTFRTNVLMVWTLSNALLGAAITSLNNKDDASKAVSGYMAFLLYAVAGLAFVRFVGSTVYMVVRLFAGE